MIVRLNGSRLILSILAVLALGVMNAGARAQCLGNWVFGPDVGLAATNSANGYANVNWDPDGDGPEPELLVVGGTFQDIGNVIGANRVAAWDGRAFRPLGVGFNGTVYALTVFNGELIAGGSFTTSGGTTVNRIARWNGVSWQPLLTGVSSDVYALQVFGGNLYVGGFFTQASGVTVNRLARWTGAAWESVGGGFNDTVWALTIHDNALYAGGEFTASGATTGLNRVARWTGSAWANVNDGVSGAVYALVSYQGELVAGGAFLNAGAGPSIAAARVARWNGTQWRFLGTGVNNIVRTLRVFDDLLYAGGSFTQADSGPANYIATWDGFGWIPLPASNTATVRALGWYQGELVAAGDMATTYTRFDGQSWRPLFRGIDPGSSSFYVENLTVFGDDLIAGGRFDDAGGVRVNNIAARTGNGGWRSLGGGVTGGSNYVGAAAVFDGELIVGGNFTSAGGQPALNIAKWNGASWSPLGAGINGTVECLRVWNGELYAGGQFTQAGGAPAVAIARWNGSGWQSVGGSTTGASGTIYALEEYAGRLYLGGTFGAVPGVSGVRNIASWDGTTWRAIGSGTGTEIGTNDTIRCLKVYNNQLYVGGQFTLAGNVTGTSRVARWNGTVWTAASTGANGIVYAMEEIGNRLVVVGTFTTLGGSGATRVGRWNGTSWQFYASDGNPTGPNDSTRAVASYRNETVIAGDFATVLGRRCWKVARWSEDGVAYVQTQPMNINVAPNSRAVLAATPATGYEGLTVQWKRLVSGSYVNINNGPQGAGAGGGTVSNANGPMGLPISYGQTAFLIIDGVQPADTGSYTATFTSACGSVTTLPALINVTGNVGACCLGSTCIQTTQSLCTGSFTAVGAACNVPGNFSTPCCRADFNGGGGLTVQDVFDYLVAFFGNDPQGDFNQSGGVSVQDVFDFLTAWFAGCP